MNKKLLGISLSIILVIFIAIIIVGKIAFSFLFTSGFDIKFSNKTNKQIEGLKITYNNITKDIDVPYIRGNSSINININPKESFGENSMKIYYFDKNNTKIEETLIGYFEKGYSGNIIVEIQSIGEDGKLNIKVNQKNLW